MVKSIYLTMLVSYFILFVFLCFTDGSIRYFIQQNMLYILLPMALPFILLLVGLNDIKIENLERMEAWIDDMYSGKLHL